MARQPNKILAKFWLVCLLSFSSLLLAQQPTTENDRLIATGKLWITVKYFHPYLAYRDIDWDKALVDALPKIRTANSAGEYAIAIDSMLAALHDPSTCALPKPELPRPSFPKFEIGPDGTLIVSQSNTPEAKGTPELLKAIGAARNTVFDLRGGDILSYTLERPEFQNALTAAALDAPAQRTWVHKGLAPETPIPSSSYTSAFYAKAGPHIAGTPGLPAHRIAFLLGQNSELPVIGSALLANGQAAVLTESSHYQIRGTETINIVMGDGIDAMVRLSEPLGAQEIRLVSHEDALPQALAAVTHALMPAQATPQAAAPAPRHARAYPESRYPSAEYRTLAAYKIWGVFHYFFAYRDLMDEDWDDLFPAFLSKALTAKDAREYNLAVAETLTHLADSHVNVSSKELQEFFGEAPVGLRIRLIEKKPVITEILDDEAKKAGIQVGDIVSKVDGESIVDRFNREAGYVSASTPQSHGYRVIQRVLNGPEGSPAALSIGGQDGRTREVSLKRSTSYSAKLREQRSGEIIRLLGGNIGYADLDRLMPEQVDAMFDKFRDTKAIIFDMRGYPHSTAWPIALHLTREKDVPAAIFTGPLALTPDLPHGEALTSTASYFFVQRIPDRDKPKYKGKTVMLIDERTISQAEHTGLFFEAANQTEFIGTPSAGANGDISTFTVPGGITITFSGHDVRHANGGKLQRLGLQPNVNVAPTINGIRTGRDEVLEKAIEHVSK